MSSDPNWYVMTDEFDHQVKAQGNRKHVWIAQWKRMLTNTSLIKLLNALSHALKLIFDLAREHFFMYPVGLRLQTSSIFSLKNYYFMSFFFRW